MARELPKSWNCTKCGKEHEFGVWYAAHSSEPLLHNCECGAIHSVRNYYVKFDHMNLGRDKAEAAK